MGEGEGEEEGGEPARSGCLEAMAPVRQQQQQWQQCVHAPQRQGEGQRAARLMEVLARVRVGGWAVATATATPTHQSCTTTAAATATPTHQSYTTITVAATATPTHQSYTITAAATATPIHQSYAITAAATVC